MRRGNFDGAQTASPSFLCGTCEWNADGTIRHLSFDCPVHAPRDERIFSSKPLRLVMDTQYLTREGVAVKGHAVSVGHAPQAK